MAIENNRRRYREDTIDSGIPKDFIPNRFNKMGVDYGSSYGGGMGGTNLVGGVNLDYFQQLRNRMAQQQGPQLGPDDFGSYTIPASDPTYRSGFDYARSIAGGIPMSQVIAPGVSYSPEMPMGYTQEQLTTPVGTTPVEPPPTQEPDDPRYFGTGIGGVNIPVDRKDIPFRNIFGGTRDIRDVPPLENLLNIGKLFDGGFDKEAIDRIVQERIAENMPTEDIPSFIPKVPTGRDFSIDREVLERPMISGLENRDLMDVDSLITQVPTGRDFSVDRERIPPQDFGYGPGVLPPLPPMDIRDIPPMDIIDIPPKINDQIFIDDRPIIDERIVDRGYGPDIMPPLPPIDIDKVIPPKMDDQLFIDDMPIIDERILMPPTLPPVDIPFIPFIKPPLIMDRPLIMDTPSIMDRPTGSRFSISQPRPMGLF